MNLEENKQPDHREDNVQERKKNSEKSEKIKKNLQDDDTLKGYLYYRFYESKEYFKQIFKNILNAVKNPKKTLRLLFLDKYFITTFLAIVVGIISALFAWGFEWLSYEASIFFQDHLFGLIFGNTKISQIVAIITIPLIASALTAPFLWKIAPETKGSGIPMVIKAIGYHDSFIPNRTPFVKLLASSISLGGGLSVGREGPVTQIGAGLSSIIGRFFKLHGRKMRIVVISGLSAAIAATFNSPIGGALFGIEILLVSLNADEIIPIVLASLTSAIISAVLDIFYLTPNSNGYPEPSFNVGLLKEATWDSFMGDIHWLLLLGIFAGLVAIFYTKFFHFLRGLFERLPIHPLLLPISGGLLTGLVGLLSPQNYQGLPLTFGGGYETITAVLNDDYTVLDEINPFSSIILLLAVLAILKLLATTFSIGTGNSGGIFAPALFIGCCSGGFFSKTISLLPNESLNHSVFALMGLASVFAGATKAPLTMIIMSAEMTGNFVLLIPLMLTCSVSYLLCRFALKESIYTQSLADEGLAVSLAGPTELLAKYKVEDVMTRDVICVPKDMTMEEFYSLVLTMDHLGYPIIDIDGTFQGIITTSHLKKAQIQGEMAATVYERGVKEPQVLYPDQSVDEAMRMLYRSEIGRLVVLDSPEKRNLVGIVSNSDVLKCLELQHIQDLEKRRRVDQQLAIAELEIVEKAITERPELEKKVKVITRKKDNQLIERDLLKFLEEQCIENTIKDGYLGLLFLSEEQKKMLMESNEDLQITAIEEIKEESTSDKTNEEEEM